MTLTGNSSKGGERYPLPSERACAVLYAVVTEFIQSGEPVGSRTLSTRAGVELSPASIRAVLKDLEDDGYLMQPHTSAGRVPTRPAFQLFIDALMQVRQLPMHHAAQIHELFSRELPPGDLLQEAGRLLSDLSGLPAVVLRSRGETRSVAKVRFIAHRPGELLSVVILDDGSVENRFIQLEEQLDSEQLERVHNLLDEVTTGRTLVEVRRQLAVQAQLAQDELVGLAQLGDRLLGSALEGATDRREVIVEGRSTLLFRGGDPERVRDLMLALEDRQQLGALLDSTLSATRVQVFLGQDSSERQGAGRSPLSLVAAPYEAGGGQLLGAVATVGPTRMDYPGLVPLVETMASALSHSLRGQGLAAEPFEPERSPVAPAIDPGRRRG